MELTTVINFEPLVIGSWKLEPDSAILKYTLVIARGMHGYDLEERYDTSADRLLPALQDTLCGM